jgi:hypothetical protein
MTDDDIMAMMADEDDDGNGTGRAQLEEAEDVKPKAAQPAPQQVCACL